MPRLGGISDLGVLTILSAHGGGAADHVEMA